MRPADDAMPVEASDATRSWRTGWRISTAILVSAIVSVAVTTYLVVRRSADRSQGKH